MAVNDVPARLVRRFPGLRRLGFLDGQHIPYIQQATLSDCGPACLAMVCGYYGKPVKLHQVREHIDASRDGTNAFVLLRVGQALGLRGRGVKISDIEDFRYLPRGAVLHWRFNHFVVFDKLDRKGVTILDPALGRRRISFDEVDRCFTGVSLIFEPGESFFAEARTNGKGLSPTRRYLRHVLRSGLLTRIIVTSLLVQLLALAPPILIAIVTDSVIPSGDLSLLTIISLGMFAMVAFHLVSSLLRSHLLVHLRTKLDAVFTLDFLEHLIHLPFAFFQRRSAGDLMMRLNANRAVREILTSNVLSGMLDGTMVLIYLVIILVISPLLGALVLGLAALRILLFAVTYRRNWRLMAQTLQAEAESQSFQIQMLGGMETLKAAGTEQRAVEHWSNLFTDVLNVSLAQGRLDAWVNSILDALRIASPLAVLAVGAYSVVAGDLTLGTMLALNSLAIGFLEPLSSLISNAFQLQRLGAYMERLGDVMQTPKEQDVSKVAEPGSIRGQITTNELSFKYDSDGPYVVGGVSFELERGSYVAIVGASGSGKSTLAKLLAGLYKPDHGTVRYDGKDLRKLNQVKVRQQVGVVPQYPHLFSGTIRSNIAFADPDTPLHRVIRAARRAHVHDEIVAMPMGYDTVLTENGGSLSGGQRQRIALARALVGQPRVVLLDEATSALDSITESRILDELHSTNITRILIAHRLSTVKDADQIFVMRDGRIVEAGTYGELLAMKGWFASLVAGQRDPGTSTVAG